MKIEKQTPEQLQLTSQHWDQIKEVLKTADDYQRIELDQDLEFRFFPLPQAGYSALLSYKNRDVFHLIWEEVDGLINVTHRIVNPLYRGQGIGTEMLYVLEQRVQALSNRDQLRYSLMIETSQISVVKLGIKRGMQVTLGKDVFEDLESGEEGFHVDDLTHVTTPEGKKAAFRISKAFTPLQAPILKFTDLTRTTVLQVLNTKAA